MRYANNIFSRVHFGVYEHFTVRGFGDVIQMVDGIRQGDRRFNTQIVNVEQVELLKGPASALYGNNALGGSLNVIRKKPRNDLGLEAALSGGTWNNRRGPGLTGPLLKDKLLARFDYGFVDYEGFRRAPLRQHLASGGVTWQPTSRDSLPTPASPPSGSTFPACQPTSATTRRRTGHLPPTISCRPITTGSSPSPLACATSFPIAASMTTI